jgi:hypothetical protein
MQVILPYNFISSGPSGSKFICGLSVSAQTMIGVEIVKTKQCE